MSPADRESQVKLANDAESFWTGVTRAASTLRSARARRQRASRSRRRNSFDTFRNALCAPAVARSASRIDRNDTRSTPWLLMPRSGLLARCLRRRSQAQFAARDGIAGTRNPEPRTSTRIVERLSLQLTATARSRRSSRDSPPPIERRSDRPERARRSVGRARQE